MTDSLWVKTTELPSYPPLREEIRADVAVIGGGMAGILTAIFLAKAGLHPVVLEAEQVGRPKIPLQKLPLNTAFSMHI